MEAWREELQQAIARGLEDSDDEVEEQLLEEVYSNLNFDPDFGKERGQVGGSTVGRRYFHRHREEGHNRLQRDYFVEHSTYDAIHFRRRFQMRRELFLHLVDSVCAFDPWFVQKRDASGRLGLSSLQKCTAALRMLAYGVPADACDEYVRIGETTALLAMKRWVNAIRGCFRESYLPQSTVSDLQRQIEINTARGFPGMFGSLDCMHWTWERCPTAWQGQFQDKDGVRSVILEAIADQSTWIRHAFFGLPGGNNDINVLDRSPLVADMLRGEGHDISFELNGHVYPRFYLLTDGIYPQWSCFVHPIHVPQGEKKKHFTKMQEAARKDVERAFGILQARWGIVKNPVRQWDLGTINDIMLACIIMHNMIIEDEYGQDLEGCFDLPLQTGGMHVQLTFQELAQGIRDLESVNAHYTLRNDLIDHLWCKKGESSD